MRGYCRRCDAAVDVRGAWPGRCLACGTPSEEHPVADVLGPKPRVLLVGINPGILTARHRAHFGNPRNPFWDFLFRAGLTPRRLASGEQDALRQWGLGVTNVVTRATPGSADVTHEDIRRGRARLEALVQGWAPQKLAFVGKQAHAMATGRRAQALGAQKEPALGRPAFVLPSTSPANAAVSPREKLRWFRALARWARRDDA